MKLDKFNRFILSADVPLKRTKPFVVVCEGLADAGFISALLVHKGITDYEVGCPSPKIGGGQGKDKIGKYLEALAANPSGLRGILVVVDTDGSAPKIFKQMAKALQSVHPLVPVPTKPFTVTGNDPRSAVLLIPKKGKKGTLEHLLLEAVFGKKPRLRLCLDAFEKCVGKVRTWPANKQAKMRMTALTACHCKNNPASSVAWIWADKGNPVPINSPAFSDISDFLTDFIR